MEQQTKSLLQAGRLNEALASAAGWVKASPKNAEAWFCKSVCEMQLAHIDEALKSAKKSVRLGPNELRFKCHLASLLVADCQTRQALELTETIASRGSKQAAIYHAIGRSFLAPATSIKPLSSSKEQSHSHHRYRFFIPVLPAPLNLPTKRPRRGKLHARPCASIRQISDPIGN